MSFRALVRDAGAAVVVVAAAMGCATSVEGPASEGGGGGAGGSGGAGGGTTSTTATTTTTSTGPCVFASDCAWIADACTVGACINGQCQKTPGNDGAACDDGLFCTENDGCLGGACTGGTQKLCPATDSCHMGQCNEAAKACSAVPGNDGAACDDGDPCTLGGTCAGGQCSKGPPIDCSFLDGPCTQGICEPAEGCVSVPVPDDTPCDDGLFCTVNDTCSGGKCGGEPNPCAPPGETCLVASCDEAANACSAIPGNEGKPCNDASTCTQNETCSGGKCGGGKPANEGGPCDDGDACTTGDTCQVGACGGTPVLQCKSGDGCCAPGCTPETDDDCKLLDVAVMGGDFYTDDLRSHLAAQNYIQSAVQETTCTLAALKKYDVVILYGNMACFDAAVFDAYVQGGGGLIGTPWIYNNNGGLDSLPTAGDFGVPNHQAALDVTVTDPNDPLVAGVVFQQGSSVGWEQIDMTLKAGATSSVLWQNDKSYPAVAKWTFGQGRAVYLNFHYITSDCDLAIQWDWGKKLVYNAALWAGKAL